MKLVNEPKKQEKRRWTVTVNLEAGVYEYLLRRKLKEGSSIQWQIENAVKKDVEDDRK